ncbi:hypothetical protein [Streptomyces sp. SID3343]|uniref:hypothetical protein n=1 Tax=Streptomyces sp. SID3343 TaxID=2690260 RepID=UPI001926BC47|nr:hypothetical protein [Streptomyces sp. SID3343]
MPPRLDDTVRAAILVDIRAGKLSRNAIARAHGVSSSTVTVIAREAGRADAFDRSKTKTATRARVVDLAAQRAELKSALLTDAERLRRRAWEPYSYYERGPDGPELVTLTLPPLRETREAYTALGIALDKHLKLDVHDQGDGAEDARSMLADIMAGLIRRHRERHGRGEGDGDDR